MSHVHSSVSIRCRYETHFSYLGSVSLDDDGDFVDGASLGVGEGIARTCVHVGARTAHLFCVEYHAGFTTLERRSP